MGTEDKDVTNHSVICQAALDGDIAALKQAVSMQGKDAAAADGFVKIDGSVSGLWTPGQNTFFLKALKDQPKAHPANALQYAAFTQRAEVIDYLMHQCGMSKDAEGTLGWSAESIGSCHRLWTDETHIETDPNAQAFLHEDAPLCGVQLRSRTKDLAAS